MTDDNEFRAARSLFQIALASSLLAAPLAAQVVNSAQDAAQGSARCCASI